jgi:hypothetical protein
MNRLLIAQRRDRIRHRRIATWNHSASVPKKKKTGPKPGSGGNGHTGGMNKKPGRKPSGVPAGKTGKGGRDEMERIKALELELKKLHDGGHEDEEGGESRLVERVCA